MVGSIFATWNQSIFQKTDLLFRKNLELNPTYPFVAIKPGLYVLRVRSMRWIIGLVISSSTLILILAVVISTGGFAENLTLPTFIFIISFGMMLYYIQHRTFVIDRVQKTYEFYRGDHLVYRGRIHNVYIHLKAQHAGGQAFFYQVVLNGYLITEEALTGSTKEQERMRLLARRLARRLHVNYFDTTEVSRQHVIRHRQPLDFGNELYSNYDHVSEEYHQRTVSISSQTDLTQTSKHSGIIDSVMAFLNQN